MRFSECNIAALFTFAERLLQDGMTTIDAEYVNSQIAALTEQAKELSKHAAKMAGTKVLIAATGRVGSWGSESAKRRALRARRASKSDILCIAIFLLQCTK